VTVDRTGPAQDWFAQRAWTPHAFQQQVWQDMVEGRSGLLHATTGSGKTYAVWLGALLRAAVLAGTGNPGAVRTVGKRPSSRLAKPQAPGLQVLWLTPMRALASDTAAALRLVLPELAPDWSLGQRTGDTPSAERARQDRRLPTALVTTPESLSLLLTREQAAAELGGVHTVVVDEWHELIASKRGVQVQLALARLRRWNPRLVVWGLSATLGNLDEALATLLPASPHTVAARLVQGRLDKPLLIDTLLPAQPGRFSWAGHLGAQMLAPVVDEIERSGTTLVFTNTRSQAETWYQLLLQQKPEWAGWVALHHGSLDKEVREWVEAGLKAGRLKAVVATSSLDLGVDFLPVQRVLQLGSAKGVARLLQRAGRSGHAPGLTSRVTLVPTHTLELVEAAAARQAALAGKVEPRRSPDKPLDVLVQHLVTVALGGGFAADLKAAPSGAGDGPDHSAQAMFDEVCSAWAYRDLSVDEFEWALAFVRRGGDSLTAYPEYHRVQVVDGRFTVPDKGIARRHRLQVGTIVSDASMAVKWLNGNTLGHVEEGFIARLKAGDCFVFAGRVLEYVRTQDMAAFVRVAKKPKGVVPAWSGGKMPLSSELAAAVQALLHQAAQGDFKGPEMQAAQPMLQTQAQLSHLPRAGHLLLERLHSREGQHLFLYPFAGRNVHIGLAQLLAWRLARQQPNSFSLSVNDYGLEVLAAKPVDLDAALQQGLFSTQALLSDVLASLNSGELAQRRFREIARVAGLVFGGYPGAPKSMRQLQASSSLFFEVFRKYDSGNRLLAQADTEVLQQELDIRQLEQTLSRMAALTLDRVDLLSVSPFALPLMVERLREQLSTEKLKDKLERLLAESESQLAATKR
jgi:ATP-dependent Lhr-like helicase